LHSAARAVRDQLAGEKWDVIHLLTPILGSAVIRALGPDRPYVYTMLSPVTLEQEIVWGIQGWIGVVKRRFGLGWLKALEFGVLRHCRAVHAQSEYTRRELQAIHGLGEQAIVIPHWKRPEFTRTHTKSEARRLLGWPQAQRILFTVRRHGPRYGLDVAIDALAPLAARGLCTFMVGGDGPLRHSLEGRARRLGADGDQVRFLGHLSDDELLLAYEAADLFILPTVALECFGLIVLEAMAVGCPVIATEVGAIPELVRPITPNCLVPARDVQGLRQKVEALLDGSLAVPPPQQLVRYAEQNYGMDVVVPRIVSLLEGAGATRQPGSVVVGPGV
jgi:glycosyltransferase involved in cell wall biosynthesis